MHIVSRCLVVDDHAVNEFPNVTQRPRRCSPTFANDSCRFVESLPSGP